MYDTILMVECQGRSGNLGTGFELFGAEANSPVWARLCLVGTLFAPKQLTSMGECATIVSVYTKCIHKHYELMIYIGNQSQQQD